MEAIQQQADAVIDRALERDLELAQRVKAARAQLVNAKELAWALLSVDEQRAYLAAVEIGERHVPR